MKLDKHVVDMFTELTKPADDVKMEKTCYGTISVVDGTRYVKLDGSDLLVPAASTVKTSHGDRVTVLMKNHSLTVTGNLTAPATDGEGGSSGEAGTAATIEVGTVTTGEAGSSATVTNSGTTSAAIFDFVIPRGDKGEKGDTGSQGPQGEKGDTGEPGHKLFVGTHFSGASAGELLSNLDFAETASIGDWYLNNQLGLLYQCVTAGTEGNSWWHYVATISAKANGGDADTVDGLHAQKFMQYLGRLTSGSLLDEVLALDTSGFVYCTGDVTDTPETGQHFFVDIKNSGGTISLQATRFNNGATYTNRYNTSSETWYGWTNIADGGNANTVGNKSVAQIMTLGMNVTDRMRIAEGDLNDYTSPGQYTVVTSTQAAAISNSPFNNSGYYLDIYYRATGYYIQIAMTWYGLIKIRSCMNGTWGNWKNISDGGNADTLDGLHAKEIASNPNLLINPDFKINQRGMTTYTSKGYAFDRWYLDTSDGAGSLSIGDSGLTYTVSNPTVRNELRQVIIPDVAKSLGGKTVTMSAMIDGTLYYGTASNLDIAANYVPISIKIGDVRFDLRNYPTSDKPINLYVRIGGSKDFVLPNIEYVKVELGSIATPFCPPDPATELAKCQRYYQIRSTGDIAPVDLRPTMRATPTITQLSDGNYIYNAEL